MKNYLRGISYALVLGLAACGGYIKNQNGSEYLVKLDAEPVGCKFLYKLESEVSVYDAEDARRYLENRIMDQARPGNAYLITSQRTRPNEWVVFGPERSFVLAANVYNCPNPRRIQSVGDAYQPVNPYEYQARPGAYPVLVPVEYGNTTYPTPSCAELYGAESPVCTR